MLGKASDSLRVIQDRLLDDTGVLVAEPSFYRAGSAVTLRMESRIVSGTAERLETLGHDVETADAWAFGSMQGILKDLATGTWLAGADPRRVAYAVGY